MKQKHFELIDFIKENRKFQTDSPFEQLPFKRAFKMTIESMFSPFHAINTVNKVVVKETINLTRKFCENTDSWDDQPIRDLIYTLDFSYSLMEDSSLLISSLKEQNIEFEVCFNMFFYPFKTLVNYGKTRTKDMNDIIQNYFENIEDKYKTEETVTSASI